MMNLSTEKLIKQMPETRNQKKFYIQYLVGSIMLAFAVYQLYIRDYWEASLYVTAGLAFLTMGVIKNDALPQYRKILNVLSWVLILLAGFIFLFLIRTDG